jgi:poly(3-hydroxybutyrate) depolymerase
MRSRGTGWSYHQDIPPGYDGGTPAPLVIALGAETNPSSIRSASGELSVILTVSGPIDGDDWTGDADQVRFVKDLFLRAQTQLCFDEGRVYVTGDDDGGVAAAAAARGLPETVELLRS